jgi:hypothetical protein
LLAEGEALKALGGDRQQLGHAGQVPSVSLTWAWPQ